MATNSAARERPIIMSSHSVRAILAGTKTQTRRLAKLAFHDGTPLVLAPGEILQLWYPGARLHHGYVVPTFQRPVWQVERLCDAACARGENGHHGEGTRPRAYDGRHIVGASGRLPHWPGLRLWVRETWCGGTMGGGERRWCRYAADGPTDLPAGTRWRSPMFMPRWASRLTLAITSVRGERLHAITTADIRAEGVQIPTDGSGTPLLCLTGRHPPAAYLRPRAGVPWTADEWWRALFASAWDELNAKRASWTSNPWVWALTFRRVAEGGPDAAR